MFLMKLITGKISTNVIYFHLCNEGVKSGFKRERVRNLKRIFARRLMWTGEVWEPLWSSGHLEMYKEARYECTLRRFFQ